MSNLDKSVDSLKDSVLLLESSLKTLHNSTKNVAKFRKTIYASTVFDLISDTDLNNAKQSFKTATNPQLEHLLTTIRAKVVKLKKQKVHLSNKYNLNHLRLSGDNLSQSSKLSALNDLKIKKQRMKQSLAKLQNRQFIPNLNHPDN